MIDLPAVQNVIAGWWFAYDQGDFASWPGYFTADAHFSCRSDSGATDFEEFIRADVTGRDELLRWQEEHRRASPYPLRHNATNVHLAGRSGDAVDFGSYLFVTQIVGMGVANLSSGLCLGTVREEDGSVRFADLSVILDFTDSEEFGSGERPMPS